MRKIAAIALLEIRKAFRSRVILILLGFLLLTIVGLPLTVKGDGTAAGLVQIILNYTLGLTGVLLALATLWVGCAAVSTDIEERQIQLVVTKPVSGFQVWMGKWLGLLVMNALLLTAAGIATYALLMVHLRASGLTDDERSRLNRDVLTAREQVRPVHPDLAAETDAEMQRLLRSGGRPNGLSDAQLRESLTQAILIRSHTVAPGAVLRERASWPSPAQPGHEAIVKYRFSASEIGPVIVRGEWRIRIPESGREYATTQETTAGATHLFAVPSAVVAGAAGMELSFKNLDPGVTVLFDPRDGIEILPYRSPFAENYLRALLILFSQLGLLAALGVTAGCLFSMPVASFLSLVVLLMIGLDRALQSAATEHTLLAPLQEGGPTPGPAIVLMRALYKGLYGLFHPLQTPNPFELVSNGLYVSWHMLGYEVAFKGLLYGGALLLIGVLVFNRREMALPA